MEIKQISLLLFQIKKIIIFSFFLSFIPLTQSFYFKNPITFTLSNNNIFVIHSLGIDICNPQYTTNTPKLTFTNEITDISKISVSRYSDGKFILFIIDTFYIFDENGNKIISKTSEANYNGEYYTLSAHKIDTKYYFLFGYIEKRNKYLKLYYCKILNK